MGEASVREVLAATYGLTLLVAGCYAFQGALRREKEERPGNPLPPWNAGWPEFLFLLALLAFLTLSLPTSAYLLTQSWADQPTLEPWRDVLPALTLQLGTLAVIFILTRDPLRIVTLDFSPARPGRPHPLLAGAGDFIVAIPLIYAVAFGWNQLLLTLESFGFAVPMEAQPLIGMFQNSPVGVVVLLTVMAVLLAPLTEELVFRGLLYRFLKGRFPARAAMIASALLFAWLHGNLRSFLPLFVLGLLFCRTYERRQSILAPMAMHALFNANTILLLLVGGDSMNQF